jgi:hypothetical protein
LFPKQDDLLAMPTDDPQGFMTALADWEKSAFNIPEETSADPSRAD